MRKLYLLGMCLLVVGCSRTMPVTEPTETSGDVIVGNTEEYEKTTDTIETTVTNGKDPLAVGQETQPVSEPQNDLERAYQIASEEQKKEIDRLVEENGKNALAYKERDLKILVGTLSADTPRITLDQAKAICAQIKEEDVKSYGFYFIDRISERFNEIAGAKDDQVGGGDVYAVYYLSEAHDRMITIDSLNCVDYREGDFHIIENLFSPDQIIDIPSGDPNDFFDQNFAKANDEQKLELKKLHDQYGVLTGNHEREIRVIMGEIPQDAPRVTLEQAYELLKPLSEKYENAFEEDNALLEKDAFDFVDERKASRRKSFQAVIEALGVVPDENIFDGGMVKYCFTDDENDGYLSIYSTDVSVYFPKTEQGWKLYDYAEPARSVYHQGIKVDELK